MVTLALEHLLQKDERRPFRLRTYSQGSTTRCGVAVIRSVLDSQFGASIGEESIVALANAYYRRQETGRVIDEDGISPAALAYCFHQKAPEPVKVFCSKHGNVDKLEFLLKEQELLPVLHQMISYDEEDNLEGHYLLYCGFSSLSPHYVKLFDPSRGEGYKHCSIDDFHRRWKNKDERWYLATMPEEIILPQRKFKGRYL